MSTVEDRVRHVLASQHFIKPQEVVVTRQLRAPAPSISADSLGLIETFMSLEDEFGIEIPDWDSEKLVTVQDAIDYCSEPQMQKLTRPTTTTN